ncbi:MAG: ABC-F family ATP-binding cassette domain-containing protein, partial [Bacilli bacterium]|nr:ABC-F family ATP-binding cassette domain-containing protein [Bacilli bacterium]
MFEVNNLNIKVEDRYLVKDLSFVLNKGDKLAIIGEEGNGKSTLLKSLLGICEYANIEGNINFKGNRVGYLEQAISKENLQKQVSDFLFINEFDYYEKVNDFYKYLNKINLDDTVLNQTISTLSGGEKVKISILKLLLDNPDILFLDEPTNDLDIETLEWLESFINTTDKPIIYVSHDEVLLSNTANMILHLEQIRKKTVARCTLLKVDYDTYVESRLRGIDKQTQIAKKEKRDFKKHQEKLNQVMQKVEYQQNTISRSDPHGAQLLKKKMHSLKSQEKKLDNTELTEIPDVEEAINFFFEDVEVPKTKRIINLALKELKVQDKVLAKNINLDIVGNAHLCIIGKNGVGKSTLIKLIYNELRGRADLNVGYMPQVYDDILNNYENVLDFICPKADKESLTQARTYLGNMKFTSEETSGKISNLSNGTKAKLFLMKLVLDKCNVLILDE